jgi:hypothetical protein
MRKYLITTLLFICLALLLSTQAEKGQSVFTEFASESVSVTGGSVISGFFRGPFETVVFIFRDGSFLTFSTSDDKAISVPISWVVESIETTGRAVSDIILCVHNHFSPIGFTTGDRDAYYYLRDKGFRGVFGIYYTASGKFREMEGGPGK